MSDSKQRITELNARRLLCPLPVIKTQNAVKTLQPDELLVVTCTDPGAKQDIPAWSRINGHHIENIEEKDGEIIITVKVGHDDSE